jgi:hypothetical protein
MPSDDRASALHGGGRADLVVGVQRHGGNFATRLRGASDMDTLRFFAVAISSEKNEKRYGVDAR